VDRYSRQELAECLPALGGAIRDYVWQD